MNSLDLSNRLWVFRIKLESWRYLQDFLFPTYKISHLPPPDQALQASFRQQHNGIKCHFGGFAIPMISREISPCLTLTLTLSWTFSLTSWSMFTCKAALITSLSAFFQVQKCFFSPSTTPRWWFSSFTSLVQHVGGDSLYEAAIIWGCVVYILY